MTAGDPERMHMDECKKIGGISYHLKVVNYMVRAGNKRQECSDHRILLTDVLLYSNRILCLLLIRICVNRCRCKMCFKKL